MVDWKYQMSMDRKWNMREGKQIFWPEPQEEYAAFY